MVSDNMPRSSLKERPMWNAFCEEVREIVWLASLVGGLSVAGVGLAVALVR